MRPLHHTSTSQRGATLVVALIMLTLITVMVTSAFSASSVNMQAVGNMQFRGEAVAAANKAIEQVLASPFTESPASETIEVDIDNEGNADYEVVFNEPTCVSAQQVPVASIPPSSLTLGTAFSSMTSTYYRTVWDLDANVTHTATGASVRVHQGVRVLLSQTQYDAVCT